MLNSILWKKENSEFWNAPSNRTLKFELSPSLSHILFNRKNVLRTLFLLNLISFNFVFRFLFESSFLIFFIYYLVHYVLVFILHLCELGSCLRSVLPRVSSVFFCLEFRTEQQIFWIPFITFALSYSISPFGLHNKRRFFLLKKNSRFIYLNKSMLFTL